jgi:uncharacterized membrane protein (Fun14 family)
MENKKGCIQLLLVTCILGFAMGYCHKTILFLCIILGTSILYYITYYIQTIYLIKFNSKAKDALSFKVNTENIETQKNTLNSIKKKFSRGINYYNFIEKSQIFKI